MSLLALLVTAVTMTSHAPAVRSAASSDPMPAVAAPEVIVQAPAGAEPLVPRPNADGSANDPSPGSSVPEPGTLLLVGTGIVGLAVSSRRWRRALPSSH